MSKTSWVESANDGLTDFPLQNLPFGIFSTRDHAPRIGVAIGSEVLDLRACAENHLFTDVSGDLLDACKAAALNPLMSLKPSSISMLRSSLAALLDADAPQSIQQKVRPFLLPSADAIMHLPAVIGDYTDFYASIYHATNVGKLFRPDNPLLPNYKYVPIGYHGRASSIVVSGEEIQRPSGQTKTPDDAAPTFGASRSLDYELELGFFTAQGNLRGRAIPIAEAEEHIFGLCLLNDWSARDVQAWEYQPLGPFLAKNFATTISPWVVTMEALAPFRAPVAQRPEGDPQPLPYLSSAQDQAHGAIDLTIEVWITTQRMRETAQPPVMLSRGNAQDLYWTLAQMLTHHASNGCNLRPGDLLGTGTISGPTRDSAGCLLEMTRRGAEPVALPTGETRSFLEDGDEILFRGYCQGEGHPRIGFGECRGRIVAAR